MNLNLHENREELNSECKEVAYGECKKALVEIMRSVMNKSKGIGLAANQIGVMERVIVVSTKDFSGAIINPEVTRSTDTIKLSKEGCLSFAGKIVTKKRLFKVTVEGFDEDWNRVKVNAKGLTSFCLQHEIDHLNGIHI